jgi:hypothetical protein
MSLLDLFRRGPPPTSRHVRVRRPRPHIVEMQNEGAFGAAIAQAESAEQKPKIVEVWIEVAGHCKRAELVLPDRTLIGPPTANWERWQLFDRGPLATIRLPAPEDVRQAEIESGALHSRVYVTTTLKLV